MPGNSDLVKHDLQRWVLLLGVLQIIVGCSIGFIPPTAVAWYRGIVMAHIEFTANGVLVVVLGLVLPYLELGVATLMVWFATLQIGTWTNGGAGVIAAFSGASSRLMPTINEKFPPPGGTNSALVTGILELCGITIIIALLLTAFGLFRSGRLRSQARGA